MQIKVEFENIKIKLDTSSLQNMDIGRSTLTATYVDIY